MKLRRLVAVSICLIIALATSQVQAAAAPAGIDLDVTYISRTPRYNWDASKQWPAVGEVVTFTAHIINKGTAPAGVFSFEWRVDGLLVQTASTFGLASRGVLNPTFTWTWKAGRHIVTFKADSADQVAETAENNNELDDYTDALTVGFWVERSVYADFNSKLNGKGTYSWEDWAQYQISTYNDLLAQSELPRAPRGVLTRLRLDKVTIVPDHTLFGLNYQHAPPEKATDVQWGFSVEEYLNCAWAGCYDISWNVHHELGHYLFGRVDLYGMDVQGGDVRVRDTGGKLIAGTPALPYIAWDVVHYNARNGRDLMSGVGYPDPVFLSDHTVYSLNREWPQGKRTHRGWTYIDDIPSASKLQVLDNNDQPITGVSVAVYQAVPGDGSSGPYSQLYDNTPDIIGVTDSHGEMLLGAHPFGNIAAFGITAGTILVRLVHSGLTRYVWVEVADFNVAYWAGQTTSYTHAVHFPLGSQQLHLSDNQVTFATVQGKDPVPQEIDVTMLGEGVDKSAVITPSSAPWLRLIPYSSDASVWFQPGPLNFVVSAVGLAPGTYSTDVTVAARLEDPTPQTVHVSLTVYATTTVSIPSAGVQDGWVRESTESSNIGGTANGAGGTLVVGDDNHDAQYRSILSFDTSTLPAGAVITGAALKIRKAGQTGTNPFLTHGNLLVDMQSGAFSGNAALQPPDFQAVSSKDAAITILNTPNPGGWFMKALGAANLSYINRSGVTQFRLRFTKDDNDDMSADYLSFYSGDYNLPDYAPQLVVTYYVP